MLRPFFRKLNFFCLLAFVNSVPTDRLDSLCKYPQLKFFFILIMSGSGFVSERLKKLRIADFVKKIVQSKLNWGRHVSGHSSRYSDGLQADSSRQLD